MANDTAYVVSAEKIVRGLMELRDQKLLCDVDLVAGDETFPVHRVVLAAASPYFQAMFTGGFRENEMDVVTLKEISSKGLKCVLDAIYTGEVKLTDENVDLALPVANLMQMNDIVKACETFMVNNITKNNCLRFVNVSEKFELHQVVDRANKFMLEVSFESFAATSEFNEISKERLCSYLADDRIRLSNGEIEVFRAAVKWIENNSTDTEKEVTSILKHVRFPQIPVDLLLNDIIHHCLVEQNEECKSMAKEAVKFHCNIFTQPLQFGEQYNSRGEQQLLLIPSVKTRDGFLYNVQETESKMHFLKINESELLVEDKMKVCPMSFAVRSLSLVERENYLFLFGTDSESFNPVAQRYNVSTDQWIDLKVPPQPATIGSAVAMSQDRIFLFGGMYVEKSDTKFVPERLAKKTWQYSIGTNHWAEKQMMPHPTVYAGVASHGDFIYMAGGHTVNAVGGTTCTRTAFTYAYDIRANLWLRKADMEQTRSNFCLERIEGTLYACGGGIGLSKIETYSILCDQWTQLRNVACEHGTYASSFVLGNKLYILGGVSRWENDTVGLHLVSCLDTVNNTLSKVTNLPFKCASHRCAVVSGM